MSAKQKIEQLRDGWYGFDVFSAVISVFLNGIGFFRLGFAAFGLFVSLAVTWFLSKRLLGRSSLTRFALVIVSGIGSLLGTLGLLKAGSMFLSEWSLRSVALIALAVGGLLMNVRSFRVLRDQSVRAYFD
jgi:hypothetical protein